jgi:hypothetical protein
MLVDPESESLVKSAVSSREQQEQTIKHVIVLGKKRAGR